MCWVQRKSVSTADASKMMTLAYPSTHYERIMKETEDELQLVQKALQLRINLLKELGNPMESDSSLSGSDEEEETEDEQEELPKKEKGKQSKQPTLIVPKKSEEDESDEEEVESESESEETESKSSQEEELDDPDYLKTTSIYLKKRPNETDLNKQLDDQKKEFEKKLIEGIQISWETKEKKGPFGRKVKSKTESGILVLTENKQIIKWGSSKKKLSSQIQLSKIDKVLHGYSSEHFLSKKTSPDRFDSWKCMTIVSANVEYDFVIQDDYSQTAFVCYFTPNNGMTLAQWRWIRAFEKFQEQSNDIQDKLMRGPQPTVVKKNDDSESESERENNSEAEAE
eukprot:c17078_g1_i2.p1 GENE.c17078_g1_i2~~c17078_g1_i2.p1  ORF type:complete len:340 (-),score=149.37 c17078_g1_i2:40-1059(-)